MTLRVSGTTHVTLVLCWLALCSAAGVLAQVGDRAAIDTAPPPPSWKIPPAPVRSPEESMRMMELQPGFHLELVAAEPVVQDPIAFAFDTRNRLWVLEWPSYNWPLRDLLPDLPSQPTPRSRLVVLEDTTGDGRMDHRTVFAEMDWPRGFQFVDDGVLVFALPDVVFLRDTDGDDQADRRDVVYGNLPIPVNPHSAPSSPSWTLDNWTYGLQVSERLRFSDGRRQASPAGRLAGQWGMSHDDVGRLFFSYNQDHIRGSLVPAHYATRNPHYDATAGIDVRIGLDNEVWPHAVTPGVNRRAQLRDDGRLAVFTANAAPTVYRGDQFPAEYQGNVFVGESAGRLIRRSVLDEKNGIISGRNAYVEREFLFSNDERFRPVYSANGPDGALYVADMYRGIIEGNIFLTTFLRNQIVDRGLHRPFSGMGRIYRIVHDGRPLSPRPAVDPHDATGWVSLLAHPSGYWRDQAQRMLVSLHDAAVVPAVRTLALSHADPRTRLHAAWTLEGLQAIDVAILERLLRDGSPHVRMAALRLSEPWLDDVTMRRAVLGMTGDRDVSVRRQLLYSLGASAAPEVERAMLELLRRDASEPFVVDAFVSGIAGRESRILDQVLYSRDWTEDRPGAAALVTALATAVTNESTLDRIDQLVRLAATDTAQPVWRRRAILDGLAASRSTPGAPPPPALGALALVREPELRERAQAVMQHLSATSAAPAATSASPAASGSAAGVGELGTSASRAMIEEGRAAYAICAACHQQDGRGVPALAPPLVGAATVSGPAERLIDIVVHGRDELPAYPSMPPLAGLSDDQLAAVLTYVRQAWGNQGSPVTAADVAARRAPR